MQRFRRKIAQFGRKKRNIGGYERAGVVAEKEAEEAVELAKGLRHLVEAWIRKSHPELILFDFWNFPSFDELAELQGVKLMEDLSILFGTWPGDVDDGFEEEIRRLRQEDISCDFGGM